MRGEWGCFEGGIVYGMGWERQIETGEGGFVFVVVE